MQHLCQQVQTFESKLVETRQQVRDLAGRIQLAERQVYDVQHQIEHTDPWPRSNETAIAAVRDQDQKVNHLWQELDRLAQKEDRLRHEKLIAAQLELTLYEALLQLEAQTGLGLEKDVEGGRCFSRTEDNLAGPHYCTTVRLIPPFLIACFLVSLFAWFGVDVQKKTDGLSTTQKVASIGSASFTVMTIVALFVRAAMCTGEWQWILHACYRLTGCRWLHPTPLQWQQSPMKDKPSVMTVASSVPVEATCSLDVALDTTPKADPDRDSLPSSPGSMDSSTFEEWKKQS